MEVYDNRRGSSYEEPSLQTDSSIEHALHCTAPPTSDRYPATEQAARVVGATELLAALYLQELLHIRTMVQRAFRHYRRKGETQFSIE